MGAHGKDEIPETRVDHYHALGGTGDNTVQKNTDFDGSLLKVTWAN